MEEDCGSTDGYERVLAVCGLGADTFVLGNSSHAGFSLLLHPARSASVRDRRPHCACPKVRWSITEATIDSTGALTGGSIVDVQPNSSACEPSRTS
jgi:hypothetical protein